MKPIYLPTNKPHWSYNPDLDTSRELHRLATRKRARNKAMAALGLALLATATQRKPEELPLGSVIKSTEPFEIELPKRKTKQFASL